MISYPLDLPANIAPNGQTIEAFSNVAEVVSPFTKSSQTQGWASGDCWYLGMSYPPMSWDKAADMVGFLSALDGKAGVFYAGPGVGTTPRGTAGQMSKNLVLWSEDLTRWSGYQHTITPNVAWGVHGLAQSVDAFNYTGEWDSYINYWRYGAISAGQTITLSVWLWVPSGTLDTYLIFTNTLPAGGWDTNFELLPVHLTTTPQRFVISAVANNPGFNFSIGGNGTIVGKPAGSIYVWGAQVEVSPYATDYISRAGDAICINGANQTGRILLVDGCPPNSGVLKNGDWFQLGSGYNATRIQTTGGSSILKYFVNAFSPGINGQKYVFSIGLHNLNNKDLEFSDGVDAQVYLLPGTRGVFALSGVGDGINNMSLALATRDAEDSIDCVAWNPIGRRFGIEENAVPYANRDFTAWTAYSGSSVALTQGINQRLYQVTEDVTSDADGNAEIPIFPKLRHSPFDNEPLVFNNPKGVFRLTDNKRSWSIDKAKKLGISFSAKEAL